MSGSASSGGGRQKSARYPLKCHVCGHTWNAYLPNPKVCQKCKNPAWSVPRNVAIPCPIPGCNYVAEGDRARTKLAKHLQNTSGDGHGDRYEMPKGLDSAQEAWDISVARARTTPKKR